MEQLIDDYMRSVGDCLDIFEQRFGRRDLLRAAAEGVLGREGELAEGVQYQLHGVGCRVEYPDHEIDFDFATPSGEVGFDAWRLWVFAEQFPEKYPDYQQRKAIEDGLSECVSNGAASFFNGSDGLLRLTE